MEDIERLKQLAGINNIPSDSSMGENLSMIGTKKAEYQRKHNIQWGLFLFSSWSRNNIYLFDISSVYIFQYTFQIFE